MYWYICVMLISVFLGAVSQVMLKKSAQKKYNTRWQEYCNPLVFFAYLLFAGTTLLTIIAYKRVPLSLGPILEATSYIYVTFFGVIFFKENINIKTILSIFCIILGIMVYSLCG